jgi:hypothetical protein
MVCKVIPSLLPTCKDCNMSQENYYIDEIYYLNKRFENDYYQDHHLEAVRKLNFLVFIHPENEFYQSLKEQSWRSFFSSKQKKCIDRNYLKHDIHLSYISKKKKGRRYWNKGKRA